jgi:preprotein translocase subunit SecG
MSRTRNAARRWAPSFPYPTRSVTARNDTRTSAVHILSGILTSLLILTSLFMICLVLIQRGKGGGLAGAFGGMGGSSAFGTKAGDVFTRVTMITALVWILMSMILVVLYNREGTSAWDADTPRAATGKAKEVTPSSGGTSKLPPAPASSSSSSTTPKPSTTTTTGPSSAAPASEPVSVPGLPAEKPASPSSK